MYKVLITPLPFGEFTNQPLKQLLKNKIKYVKCKKEDVINKISDCDFYIAGNEKVTDSIIKKAKKLKLIARIGIGVDNLNLDLLKKQKIILTNTPDPQSESVAEFTLGLIICLTRNITLCDRLNRKGIWLRHKLIDDVLTNKRIGIIGVGRIGSKVLKKLKLLGVKKIFCYDKDQTKLDKYKKYSRSLNFIKKNSDIISLHIPLNKKSKNLINKKFIKECKNNPVIVNTSRGEIINEVDLIKALKDRTISGAALDVFKNEPLINKEFLKLKNCILTSHIAAMTKTARQQMELECVDSIVRYIKKKNNPRIVI